MNDKSINFRILINELGVSKIIIFILFFWLNILTVNLLIINPFWIRSIIVFSVVNIFYVLYLIFKKQHFKPSFWFLLMLPVFFISIEGSSRVIKEKQNIRKEIRNYEVENFVDKYQPKDFIIEKEITLNPFNLFSYRIRYFDTKVSIKVINLKTKQSFDYRTTRMTYDEIIFSSRFLSYIAGYN